MAYWVSITVAGAQRRAVDRARTLLSQNFPLSFVYRPPSFFWELWALVSSQRPGLGCGSVVEHLQDVQKATVPCILRKKIPALLGGVCLWVYHICLFYWSVCLSLYLCHTVLILCLYSKSQKWVAWLVPVSFLLLLLSFVYFPFLQTYVITGFWQGLLPCTFKWGERTSLCTGPRPHTHEHGMPLHFVRWSLTSLFLLSSQHGSPGVFVRFIPEYLIF